MKAKTHYTRPASISEVIDLTKKHGEDCRIIAGGTDVMPNRFHGIDTHSYLIDISGLEELNKITVSSDSLVIGALVKLADLSSHDFIPSMFPVIVETAEAIASPVIRKTASIGGNILCENRCMFYNQTEWWREAVGFCLKCEGDICIATGGKKNCFSKFVSDMAITLISLDASVHVISEEGAEQFKLEDIYSGVGVNPKKLHPSKIVTSISIPLVKHSKSVFKKLRMRETLEFSSLTTCITHKDSGQLKIVLGGVDPGPVVLLKTTADAKEDIITSALKKSRIVDNDVFTRDYRREMIRVYLKRSFEELGI